MPIGFQNTANFLRRPHRKGRFFDNNFITRRNLRNSTHRALDVRQIRCFPGTIAVGFGRRINGKKNNIRRTDGVVDVGRKRQIFAAYLLDNFVQPGLKHRQFLRIPRRNAPRIDIRNFNFDFGTLLRDDDHRRSADIPRSDTADFHCFVL